MLQRLQALPQRDRAVRQAHAARVEPQALLRLAQGVVHPPISPDRERVRASQPPAASRADPAASPSAIAVSRPDSLRHRSSMASSAGPTRPFSLRGRLPEQAPTSSRFSLPSSIADQSLFLTDLVDFFRVQPKVRSKPGALPAPRPIRDRLRFEGVSFSYPGSPRRILDNLDLRIEPGERIALIGENGQGKTTIVKLITRLYDPRRGGFCWTAWICVTIASRTLTVRSESFSRTSCDMK